LLKLNLYPATKHVKLMNFSESTEEEKINNTSSHLDCLHYTDATSLSLAVSTHDLVRINQSGSWVSWRWNI